MSRRKVTEEQAKNRIVHILRFGQVLCRQERLKGVPATWPTNEFWVGEEKGADATCQLCIAESRKA